MRMPRFGLAQLMAMVGVLGVNLAAGVGFLLDNPILRIAFAAGASALELALYRLVRRRSPYRPFRAGMVVAASLVLLTFVWARATPPVLGMALRVDPATGKLTRVTHVTEGSPMAKLWEGYGKLASRALAPLEPLIGPEEGPVALSIEVVIWLAPHLLVALGGGVLTWAVARAARRPRAMAAAA